MRPPFSLQARDLTISIGGSLDCKNLNRRLSELPMRASMHISTGAIKYLNNSYSLAMSD